MLGQNLSEKQYKNLCNKASTHSGLIDIGKEDFDNHFNKRPFLISHRLAEHTLFQLDKLLSLCTRLPENQVKYRVGEIPYEAEFDTSFEKYGKNLTLADVINNFEQLQAYIAIYNPEKDEAYRETIEQLIGIIGCQLVNHNSSITWYSAYLFLSTLDSVTPYHVDREMNFLLQITGNKTAKLWERFDYEVFSPELQDKVFGDLSIRKPPYKEGFENSVIKFDLAPGQGVHLPFLAPHLVKTDSNISISLALTFRTTESDIWRDAHIMNFLLRKIGITPKPIGNHAFRDKIKAWSLRNLQFINRIFKIKRILKAYIVKANA